MTDFAGTISIIKTGADLEVVTPKIAVSESRGGPALRRSKKALL